MTYEKVKTIILTILVITSSVLTWNIWTYQPEYDTMESTNTVPEVALSEQKSVNQIIKPDQIFYHQKDQHLGTVNAVEIEKVMRELNRWNFDHFEDVSAELNISDFLNTSGHAEIVFSEYVPMEIYKTVLDIQDKDGLAIVFDRIVIDLNNVTNESGFVYFISMDHHKAFRSRITSSFIKNFEENFYNQVSSNPKFVKYSEEKLSNDHRILVSSDPVTMNQYTHLFEHLPTDKFRDALFSDPSFVQRTSTISGEEYTDSSTLLSVNYDTNIIKYVNPAQQSQYTSNSNDILQQSINFVNGHGGWTGNYRYVAIDEKEQTVLFRLYESSGYPIFSNHGMSEMLQIWGQTEIHQYMRNNFSLSRQVELKEVSLPSGVDTLENLKKTKGINLEFLQDLRIGYEMVRDSKRPLIHLQPAWFYKYQDQWSKVTPDNEGGTEDGLE